MIRYLLDERIPAIQAAQCQHPKLARLAGCGPWSAGEVAGGMMLSRGEAPAWGPEHVSPLDGLRFQLAEPLPLFRVQDFLRPNAAQGNLVRLRCGHTVPVLPAATLDGLEIQLDGSFGAPAGDYARLGQSIYDRLCALQPGQVLPLSDPELIAFARAAIMSCTTLTAELVHAYRLLSTADLEPLLESGTGLPKPDGGGG